MIAWDVFEMTKQKIEDTKMYSVLGSEIKAIANDCNDPFNVGLKEKLAALKTILKRNG